jgi:hypothetical protein
MASSLKHSLRRRSSSLALSIAALAALGLSACTETAKPTVTASTQLIGQPAMDQESFATSDDAALALINAVKDGKTDELDKIFGPEFNNLSSGDPVQDKHNFAIFIKHANERAALEDQGTDRSVLYLGTGEWPFPIPIVKAPNGKWFFDTKAGESEIVARRIGRNELAAIRFCGTFVDAEKEYASQSHDDSGVHAFAAHLLSTPGTHNGLYWENKDNPDESPLGPLAAQAEREGYSTHHTAGSAPQPFHGYLYHILTRQGKDAPGGSYSYIVNGHLISGFALIAWPAQYNNSGRMTFLVNQQGQVYQKDLGDKTDELAPKIKAFNPDKTWSVVSPSTTS